MRELETAFIGLSVGVIAALAALLVAWINTRARQIKLKAQITEVQATQEKNRTDFVLDQARRADEIAKALRDSDAARLGDIQQLGELKGKVGSLQQQIEAAGIAANLRDQQIGRLEGTLKAEQDEKARLLVRVAEIERVAHELSRINEELRQERDRAVTDKRNVQQEVDELKRRVKRLEEERQALIKAVLALGGTLPDEITHESQLESIKAL